MVGAHTQCSHQCGDRQFPRAVHADIDDLVGVRLVFQPGAPVGNDLCCIQQISSLVRLHAEVGPRRTNQLGDHNPLRSIDDKCPLVCHDGKIAHEDFLLFHLTRLVVDEPNHHLQGCSVCRIPVLTLLHGIFRRILRRIQLVVEKLQYKIPRIVFNGRNVRKDFAQPFADKPIVRFRLDLNEIWHVCYFMNFRVAHPCFFTDFYGLGHIHHSLFRIQAPYTAV